MSLFTDMTRARATVKADQFIDDGKEITFPDAEITIKNRALFYHLKNKEKNPAKVLEIILAVGSSFINYTMINYEESVDSILEKLCKEEE